jgi:hypothetical protein
MAHSQTPVSFSSLPPELRASIYQYAIPHRTLQVGFDFPFPYLPNIKLVDPKSTWDDKILYDGGPAITRRLPTIFHLCQESRALALTEYIPFSYSYLHPVNDTLYISKEASAYMYFNPFAFQFNKTAHLYPLAAIEKIMFEFVWEDLDITRYIIGNICELIKRFGAPKEIVFVAQQPLTDLGPTKRHFHGYEGLELVATPQSGCKEWSEALMRKRLADECGRAEWVESWDAVNLTAMDMKHTRVVAPPFTRLDENERLRVYRNADALLQQWKDAQAEAPNAVTAV